MRNFIGVACVTFLITPLLLAADDCRELKNSDQEEYMLCLEAAVKVSNSGGDDCIECRYGQDRKPTVGETIVEGLGVIAGPLAYFGSNLVWSNAYRDSNESWANAYQSGWEACTNQFDLYTTYLIDRGANPLTADEAESFTGNCNGYAYGQFAGYGGMTGTGFGGYGNGYLGAGYSSGFLSGMMGPNYYGMYGSSGLGMGLGLGMGMLGMSGLTGGGGLYLNLGLNSSGMYNPYMMSSSYNPYAYMNMNMNPYAYMNMNTNMNPYAYMNMNTSMNPYAYMNMNMNMNMNPYAYMNMNTSMNPYAYMNMNTSMNPYAYMSSSYYPGATGITSYNPWQSGSYWNNSSYNTYQQQQQQYYQQYYQQQQQYYQQQQALYQQQSELNQRAQGNVVGNYYANQALYEQYMNAGYDYYNNMGANNYSYYGSSPYAYGNLGLQFGFGLY